MRILVTGSRNWTSPSVIRDALAKAVAGQPGPHTLVQGGANGADRIAAHCAAALGWTVETHKADWDRPCGDHCHHRGGRPKRANGSTWCPSAGAIRNAQMCKLGADLALAFYARGEKNAGTGDCVKQAGKNEIPIRRFTA